MKKTKLQQFETKLKRQKTYYENKIRKLKKQILETPHLYNEAVCQGRLFQNELYEARCYINALLMNKCKDSKLKEAIDFFNKVEIRALVDSNISLNKRVEDLTLTHNRMVHDAKSCESEIPKKHYVKVMGKNGQWEQKEVES